MSVCRECEAVCAMEEMSDSTVMYVSVCVSVFVCVCVCWGGGVVTWVSVNAAPCF